MGEAENGFGLSGPGKRCRGRVPHVRTFFCMGKKKRFVQKKLFLGHVFRPVFGNSEGSGQDLDPFWVGSYPAANVCTPREND